MTPDGRFIAFYSLATTLTPEATAGIFWRDPWHGPASYGRFSADALPAGASLDARSGALAWQPAAGVGGTHDIVVTRTCGGSREQLTVRIVFEKR